MAVKKYRWSWIERKVVLDAITFRLERADDPADPLVWRDGLTGKVLEDPLGPSPAEILRSVQGRLRDDYRRSERRCTYRLSWEERDLMTEAFQYAIRKDDRIEAPDRGVLAGLHNQMARQTPEFGFQDR